MRSGPFLCVLLSAFVSYGTVLAQDNFKTLANTPLTESEHTNPVAKLNGKVWQQSSLESKKALLLGVECSVIIEHAIDAKRREQAETAKAPSLSSSLSPFQKGWAQVFAGVSNEEIVSYIDAWYAANPDKLERPVFDVIWYKLIEPKYKR